VNAVLRPWPRRRSNVPVPGTETLAAPCTV
jgi:hypothetical protein